MKCRGINSDWVYSWYLIGDKVSRVRVKNFSIVGGGNVVFYVEVEVIIFSSQLTVDDFGGNTSLVPVIKAEGSGGFVFVGGFEC